MKKNTLIAYTVTVLILGALLGGAITGWAMNTVATLGVGQYRIKAAYYDENKILIQVLAPKVIESVQQNSGRIATIRLKD
ncbi:hypothetical protein D0S45_17005 [Marinifilum sp. JC120]|nr:hypothetical protein D0S45_17005 [Marinifilum sp. JC120]